MLSGNCYTLVNSGSMCLVHHCVNWPWLCYKACVWFVGDVC